MGGPRTDRRRGESRQLKKDQQIRREVRDEIGTETFQGHNPAQYRNPNRNQSRGDWDRSRRHADEGSSRDEGKTGDDGLRASSNPKTQIPNPKRR